MVDEAFDNRGSIIDCRGNFWWYRTLVMEIVLGDWDRFW